MEFPILVRRYRYIESGPRSFYQTGYPRLSMITAMTTMTTRATLTLTIYTAITISDDVIKWKHFPRYWQFVRGIHRSPVNSLHKGQWRGAFIFSLISARINGWVNNGEAGDFRRHRAHYDVTVMQNDYDHGEHKHDHIFNRKNQGNYNQFITVTSIVTVATDVYQTPKEGMWANIYQMQILNTLRPRQNGRRFPDDIFKYIFLNENVWISLKISLKCIPKVRINNIPALFHIMACRLAGANPLSDG